MNRTILWAVTVLATPLWGQEVGDRLRIEVEDVQRPLIGTLTAVRGEKLIVERRNGTKVSVELGRIAGLKKSVGHRTYGKRGLVIGCLTGWLIAGVSLAAAAEDDPETPSLYDWEPGTSFLIGAVALIGGATGAIGGLIGLLIRAEQWKPIEIVSKGGPQVGLRMRF